MQEEVRSLRAIVSEEYREIRCTVDKTLLFRARGVMSGYMEIEVKCRRCKKTRLITLPKKEKVESAEGRELKRAG